MADLFVDTNVFLRFLTNDDPAKASKIEAVFRKAVTGKISLITTPLVIAEIVWTLESYYDLAKPDIESKVNTILNTPNLTVSEHSVLLQALDLYASRNVDFIDAYNALAMHQMGVRRILTYDRKHFSRFEWVERVEP
jgi:predicted nucleic-acid-binding protein